MEKGRLDGMVTLLPFVVFLQQVIFLLGSFFGCNQQVFPSSKWLQCGCLLPAHSPPSPNPLCRGTCLSLPGISQQREAPAQGHGQVTAVLCVMLVMDISTPIPSWEPGHSLAPCGCTGEPQAQSTHAEDGAATRPSCLGCPVALHPGRSSPW